MFKQLTKETRDRKLKELEKAEGIICINPEDYVMVHEANPDPYESMARMDIDNEYDFLCPECGKLVEIKVVVKTRYQANKKE